MTCEQAATIYTVFSYLLLGISISSNGAAACRQLRQDSNETIPQPLAEAQNAALELKLKPYVPKPRYEIGKVNKQGSHYKRVAGSKGRIRDPVELADRPFCGQLSFDTPVDGAFYKSKDTGHYFFEPDTCKLRRLSRGETQKCLEGRTIVFIGDSVTRYQFTTLAHFLAAGKYHHPYDDGKRSVSNVLQYDMAYTTMYKDIQKQVEGHDDDSRMTCKCDRSKSMEQWHYRQKFLVPGQGSKKGFYDIWYKYTGTGSDSFLNAVKWAMKRNPRPSKDLPNLVLLNACAHYGTATSSATSALKSTFKKGADMVNLNKTQLVWKACSKADSSWHTASAKLKGIAADFGWPTYDVHAITAAAKRQNMLTTWHSSTVHLLPFMYEQFNDLLLNIICPAAPVAPAVNVDGDY